MNIMQYFTKAGLAKYLKDNEITKIIAEPIFENQLNDLAEEVIYFSADETSRAHNEALGKKKKMTRGENPISSAEALQSKLEEIGVTEISSVARISDKSVKLGGADKEIEKIHRLLYTPPC
tara:strand:+ start:628 stop:990 length:363 start_codon:yes stop_codon:yes gene_type:complete